MMRTTLALALLTVAGCAAEETFVRVQGGAYRLPRDGAVTLIFIGRDCPISNAYSPEINRLCRDYGARGVAFCLVYAESDLGAEEGRRHAADFGYTCPAILDPKFSLALKVGATVTPEAAVLGTGGELLYRGRIDDLFYEPGKRRPAPTTRELRDALDAVLAGRPVPAARTEALGCPIDLPGPKKN